MDNNNQNEIINEQEVQTNNSGQRDLETFFKEHRDNGEEYEVRKFGGVIVFLALIALLLGGYIVFDKFLRIEEPTPDNGLNGNENGNKIANEFDYDNYSLVLPKEIDSSSDIYAIDVKTDDYNTYELYGRYTNEKEVKVATITRKDKSDFEYRSIDVEDNKLYYMIVSKESGTIFELEYIDFNDLESGGRRVPGFNDVFKNDNLWENSGKESYYSSQIYVKGNDIFYTSYTSKSLKKYNTDKRESVTVLENIIWDDYFVDKLNGNIYYQDNDEVYITDLNGKDPYKLETAKYNGKKFWLKAFYNNMPTFGFPSGGTESVDIYVYRASRKEFIRVEENAYKYNIEYNNIDMEAEKDEKVLETLFIS